MLALATGTAVVLPTHAASAAVPTAYTWQETADPATAWRGVAVAGDGESMLAVLPDGVRQSSDGGTTWRPNSNPAFQPMNASGGRAELRSLTTSENGNVIVIGTVDGPLRRIVQGAGWSTPAPLGVSAGTWTQVTTDSDGSAIAAIDSSRGRLVSSTDAGATWAAAPDPVAGEWSDVAMNGDGSVIIGAVRDAPAAESVYRSVDGGASWSPVPVSGVTSTDWVAVDVDRAGTTIALVRQTSASHGSVHLTTDGALTWRTSGHSGDLADVAVSRDGSTIVTGSTDVVAVWDATLHEIDWTDIDGAAAMHVDVSSNGRKAVVLREGHAPRIGTRIGNAPTVLEQPVDQYQVDGEEVTFSARADEAATSVQWQRSFVDGWVDVTDGDTEAVTVTVDASAPNVRYRAAFRNAHGITYTDAVRAVAVTAPEVDDFTAPTATVGRPFTWVAPASGSAPLTFSFLGAPPAWASIDRATGRISGIPDTAGRVEIAFTVANRAPNAGAGATLVLDVQPAATAELGVRFAVGERLRDGLAVHPAGSGLRPTSEWTVDMFSTPTRIGSGTVGADGSFGGAMTIPSNTPAGAHRLVLSAVSRDGDRITNEAWFAIDASGVVTAVSTTGPVVAAGTDAVRVSQRGGLAETGAEIPVAGLAGLGALLLAVAGGMFVARRRRRTV